MDSNIISLDWERKRQAQWNLPQSSLERINHIRIKRLEASNADLSAEVQKLTETINKLLQHLANGK